MIDSEVTLLPDPDSPTMATVSRGATSKEILRTTDRHSSSTRKDVVRSRTDSTGSTADATVAPAPSIAVSESDMAFSLFKD